MGDKPINAAPEVEAQWRRYVYLRDNGHTEQVKKAQSCDAFYRGEQWAKEDLDKLKAAGRPSITVNKILPTINMVMGEQATNRAEVMFKPRKDANKEVAEVLTKVFMQISDNNKLDWVESEVFEEGLITSRGFYDVRISFDDQMVGEVEIASLNSNDVMIDPDACSYDPKDWSDVITTRWMSLDDIEMLYGKENANNLRNKSLGDFNFGSDSISRFSSTFKNNAYGFTGNHTAAESESMLVGDPEFSKNRRIRVIERQHRKISNTTFFVDPATGDTRVVPDTWKSDRIEAVAQKYNLGVVKKPAKRIRWTVTADTVKLHDDWSPYREFTIVPYFPFFRHGYTVGLVENLRSAQELLNKTASQELHIINTTANSGYDIEEGQLVNMTIEELEQSGSKTGLVIERKRNTPPIEKIKPNQVPTGIDRMSMRAENFIKEISSVSDSMLGFDREDVAAKAIQFKTARGSVALARAHDNLQRTRHLLAERTLGLVQQYYQEERVIQITGGNPNNPAEVDEVVVNEATPEGEILNDLTAGEYDVVISSVPAKDTFQDGQFEEAMRMREAGIAIQDADIIEQSHLSRRNEMASAMRDDPSEADQQMQQLEIEERSAEVAKKNAEARLTEARAAKEEQAIQGEEGEVEDAKDELTHEHETELEQMKQKHEASENEKDRDNDVLIATLKVASDEEKAAGKAEEKPDKAKSKPQGDK